MIASDEKNYNRNKCPILSKLLNGLIFIIWLINIIAILYTTYQAKILIPLIIYFIILLVLCSLITFKIARMKKNKTNILLAAIAILPLIITSELITQLNANEIKEFFYIPDTINMKFFKQINSEYFIQTFLLNPTSEFIKVVTITSVAAFIISYRPEISKLENTTAENLIEEKKPQVEYLELQNLEAGNLEVENLKLENLKLEKIKYQTKKTNNEQPDTERLSEKTLSNHQIKERKDSSNG